MKIDSVDFFYVSMPEVLDIGDGSQDALLVRVRAGEYEGWGECEASPLTSIAAYVAPMSHSACKGVHASVLGQKLDSVEDIGRIGNLVRQNSLDLLQADHTLSGIDIALWDLLGKRMNEPVFKLLGFKKQYPKQPYASVLFGDTPEETRKKGQAARANGFRASKFGWGPFGKGSVDADNAQVAAAREGLGTDGILLVDAGTIFEDDVERASQRLAALQQHRATWFEEPFHSGALGAYKALSLRSGDVKMAGGEGCHNYYMAIQMIDHAGLGFVQIDTGRIGGISVAHDVAQYAAKRSVKFVNHTFTSNLALSASLQPFAGFEDASICEFPTELKPLAAELTNERIRPNANGEVLIPERPGLGVSINLQTVKKYLVDTEIRVGGKVIYRTPTI
ncbi:MAG TPA: mandelate racemase/muconate lactonizing enzyme family protein [Planctomycetota bacterium]|nr:mandelate racemase/muconate lactonizing enzyme family protein [Planctomycetota bacterium]